MDVVIWSGPVAKFQVPGATVPGATEHFFQCTGDGYAGSPMCHVMADGWLDGQGRRIPRMLAAAGIHSDDVDRLFLGAFSAGGSIVKRLLLHPDDRKLVKAVMLADASYTAGPTAPHSIEGYEKYMAELTADPSRLFISTTSASPNKTYGSGSDTMEKTIAAASARSGVPLDVTPVQLPLPSQPERLWRLTDNVIAADFGMQGGGHGYHPKIAPDVWQNMLLPWLSGSQPNPSSPKPPASGELAGHSAAVLGSFAAGALLGYALVMLVEQGARSAT